MIKKKKTTYKQVCHHLPSTKAVVVFGFILKRNKITKAKDERKKIVSSVRFEPGTSTFEILDLA